MSKKPAHVAEMSVSESQSEGMPRQGAAGDADRRAYRRHLFAVVAHLEKAAKSGRTGLAGTQRVTADMLESFINGEPIADEDPSVWQGATDLEDELVALEIEDEGAEVGAGSVSSSPLRALTIAALCRAFPNGKALAALSDTAALNLIIAPMPCLASLEWALAGLGGEGLKVARPSLDRESAREIGDIVEKVLASAFADRTARVIALPSVTGIPDRLLKILPEPVNLRVMSPDVIRGALSIVYRNPNAHRIGTETLRGISLEGLGLAMRQPTFAQARAELIRMAGRHAPGRTVTLDDIVGYGAAEEAARLLVADLADWSAGKIAWRSMTRSLLLYGPPGTGKTFMARAIAGSCKVPLIEGSFASWQSRGHLGDLLRAMRSTFEEARAAAPCVLMIDKIDAAGSRESPDRHSENYRRQVINGFLAEMDGTRSNVGVIVVAACNDVAALDPAIVRPGRFDKLVEVPLPGLVAVRKIVAYHAGSDLPQSDLDAVAARAVGRTAAEIDGAVREARSRARRQERELIFGDVVAALRLEEDPDLIERIAVHEAGHAVVALKLGRGVIRHIMVGPTSGEVAFAKRNPCVTIQQIEDEITCLMAGRAAEEIVL